MINHTKIRIINYGLNLIYLIPKTIDTIIGVRYFIN